ncbi:hypothetical protein Pla108_41210 [Botrimarina colliarenosi]|uniref:Uncharacterized protein n=1 Tax=Botrimarina colliarenosi TaxID=2528001 RepID=A0A5C5ZXE7_9BACT|nr:hypothetical protein Pla108_41210 [Botrimarina colliarenosi]
MPATGIGLSGARVPPAGGHGPVAFGGAEALTFRASSLETD